MPRKKTTEDDHVDFESTSRVYRAMVTDHTDKIMHKIREEVSVLARIDSLGSIRDLAMGYVKTSMDESISEHHKACIGDNVMLAALIKPMEDTIREDVRMCVMDRLATELDFSHQEIEKFIRNDDTLTIKIGDHTKREVLDDTAPTDRFETNRKRINNIVQDAIDHKYPVDMGSDFLTVVPVSILTDFVAVANMVPEDKLHPAERRHLSILLKEVNQHLRDAASRMTSCERNNYIEKMIENMKKLADESNSKHGFDMSKIAEMSKILTEASNFINGKDKKPTSSNSSTGLPQEYQWCDIIAKMLIKNDAFLNLVTESLWKRLFPENMEEFQSRFGVTTMEETKELFHNMRTEMVKDLSSDVIKHVETDITAMARDIILEELKLCRLNDDVVLPTPGQMDSIRERMIADMSSSITSEVMRRLERITTLTSQAINQKEEKQSSTKKQVGEKLS